jgi:excisionase family DNA binding protein
LPHGEHRAADGAPAWLELCTGRPLAARRSDESWRDAMSALLRALVDELTSDPVALEQLRTLLGVDANQQRTAPAPAFTVRSLATEMGRSERSVRAAITRGELEAVKRGRGYLITAAAVEAWATAAPLRAQRSTRRSMHRDHRRHDGPMRRALGGS